MAKLGLRIKKFRESRDLSQEALAKLLGVSRPTMSLIENGERKVSAEEVKTLSYERYEEQLIGATYKKNKYGPTPLEFRKIVDEMTRANEILKIPDKYFSYPQTKYLPLRSPDLSQLSAREKDVIDHVLDRLSDMNAGQISEYAHNDVPWLTTDEGEIIPYEAVFYRTPAYSARKEDVNSGGR